MFRLKNPSKGSAKQPANQGRKFEEMQTTGHAPDHPATFPEAHYLTCIYLRF
jgi:23S rRNA (cytosine1962-C5)-methyltransferase